jgi:hypothetical protein
MISCVNQITGLLVHLSNGAEKWVKAPGTFSCNEISWKNIKKNEIDSITMFWNGRPSFHIGRNLWTSIDFYITSSYYFNSNKEEIISRNILITKNDNKILYRLMEIDGSLSIG